MHTSTDQCLDDHFALLSSVCNKQNLTLIHGVLLVLFFEPNRKELEVLCTCALVHCNHDSERAIPSSRRRHQESTFLHIVHRDCFLHTADIFVLLFLQLLQPLSARRFMLISPSSRSPFHCVTVISREKPDFRQSFHGLSSAVRSHFRSWWPLAASCVSRSASSNLLRSCSVYCSPIQAVLQSSTFDSC